MKKTSLYEKHIASNAKIVDFAGYSMPVSYTSIIDEHLNVRKKCGIFDVSHMGNVFVKGIKAKQYIQKLISRDINRFGKNDVFYSLFCNESGGAIDDFFVYVIDDNEYMFIFNAANIEKDVNWLKNHIPANDLEIQDKSNEYSIIAVQGPQSVNIVDSLTNNAFSDIQRFTFKNIEIKSMPLIISRTGYTGEDGCEIYVKNEYAPKIWDLFVENGSVPAGLGARDSLRLEKGYSLYGNEITDQTNVLEAGLGWIVDLDKEDNFIGKSALEQTKQKGLSKIIRGFILKDKGIPRHGYKIYHDGKQIGEVTSGGHSPILNKGIALGFIDRSVSEIGKIVQIKIRKKYLDSQIVKRQIV